MHTVAVLVVDGVIAFDVATPIEVFGRATTPTGESAYEVLVAGPRRTARSGPISITVPHGLDRLIAADTIIVPGRADLDVPLDARSIAALRAAAARGARIASICVGAFDLAATGLLNGLRATTHWRAVGRLAAQHPEIEVAPSALYVDNGQFICSAGAASGIDACLHLVSRDLGGAIAAETARSAVVPLTRDADQAQFIRDDALGATSLTATLEWMEAHGDEPLSVAAIARHASVSVRTLNRRFAAELGLTPTAWLTRARVRRAQSLLESTDWTIERVAAASGLGSPANLRAHFARIVGTSPTRYRTALGARSGDGPLDSFTPRRAE